MHTNASALQVIILLGIAVLVVGIAAVTVIANLFSENPNDLDTRPDHLRSKFPK